MPLGIVLGASLWLIALGGSTAFGALPEVPEGFRIRLVAAVPAVQYPSQVATAPDGSLFVGEDPMDQVGPATQPIDRILLFRQGREPVVFADKLNAIFGMAWHRDSLYVMNMPKLTVFRDTDGDGKADERKDLFTDLGVPAGFPNDFNDHIVSGIKFGIDGYLYISVGDKGVPKATGVDGRTAQVVGGGVLRCRPDGTGLEVYSTGTRNHLEPNLDPRDNLFTYDNTDDGLGWWTRVTHHVDGGTYGYPYDYHNRTDRILPRMAEYGGGSPCGGVLYAEDVWPEKYRGLLFWSEWGQRTVRAFRFAPKGASFEIAEKIDFVRPGEVSDFRPLDLALSFDGKTMYIADWSMGGWGNKTEKLGRIYAVTPENVDSLKTRPRGKDSDPTEDQIRQLDHPSFHERLRAQDALVRQGKGALPAATAALADSKTPELAARHLVWVVDAIAGGTPEGTKPLIAALESPSADVRAQAARALGERAVANAEAPLIKRLADPEASVRLQAIIALGRIGQSDAIAKLIPITADSDFHLAYSARKALERIGDWRRVAQGLDSTDSRVRAGVLLTLERVYDRKAASALSQFAESATRPEAERAKALTYLAQVHRKAPPWDGKWWGTQPAKNKAPAKTIAWEGTPVVLAAIYTLLNDPSVPVRLAAIEAVVETGDKVTLADLRQRLISDPSPKVRVAIASAFGRMGDADSLPVLTSVLRDSKAPEQVRDAALEAVETIGSSQAIQVLLELLQSKGLDDGRRERVVVTLGKFKDPAAIAPLLKQIRTPHAKLRGAIIDTLAAIGAAVKGEARQTLSKAFRAALTDASADVRNRAIAAIGSVEDRAAIPELITAVDDEATRFEATRALSAMPDIRALQVYLRALGAQSPDLRKASANAVGLLRDQAAPKLDQLAARNELSPSIIPELKLIFEGLKPITGWKVAGPFATKSTPEIPADQSIDTSASLEGPDGERITWKPVTPADGRGKIDLGKIYRRDGGLTAYGYAEISSAMDRKAIMAVGSDDTLTVWVNGKQVYDSQENRGFNHEQSRFEVSLVKGTNRVLVRCGNGGGPWLYAVAVSSPADYAFLKGPAKGAFNPDEYRAAALKANGDPVRGRSLFADPKGLACTKCHAVGSEGGRVGPELSSVGAKYPRDELITAVLAPSAKIASGYEPTIFALSDGRVVSGIIKNEGHDRVEIQDSDAKVVSLAKDEIEERRKSDVSLMPNGLAQGLSTKDFADLISYLETLKQPMGSK
jgi:putative membrane-bound dehydrogenase-like protein